MDERDLLSATAWVARRRVFFVVGCQKSGTTWVQRLLDAHPAIACGGEAHLSDVLVPLIDAATAAYNNDGRVQRGVAPGDVLATVRVLADRILRGYAPGEAVGIRAVGDKTPEAALAVATLRRLYPGATFLHVIRDGRDAAVSGWAQLERRGEQERFASFADYAAYFARAHWVPYVTAARSGGGSEPGRYLELRYEALHADPVPVVRTALAALGVGDDAATAAACVETAAFERLSGGRAPGVEDRASHFRKGVVGDWRRAFDEEARTRFEREAGPLLRRLGYLEPTTAAVTA